MDDLDPQDELDLLRAVTAAQKTKIEGLIAHRDLYFDALKMIDTHNCIKPEYVTLIANVKTLTSEKGDSDA